MKDASINAARAFTNGTPHAKDNTSVYPMKFPAGAWAMELHGNLIAVRTDTGTYFSLSGWGTPTTRNRLNAIGIHVYQQKGEQMLGSTELDVCDWYRHDAPNKCTPCADGWLAHYSSTKPSEAEGETLSLDDRMKLGAAVIECLGLVPRGGMINTPHGPKSPVGVGDALVDTLVDAGFIISVKCTE